MIADDRGSLKDVMDDHDNLPCGCSEKDVESCNHEQCWWCKGTGELASPDGTVNCGHCGGAGYVEVVKPPRPPVFTRRLDD